jgi:hypothetical protein
MPLTATAEAVWHVRPHRRHMVCARQLKHSPTRSASTERCRRRRSRAVGVAALLVMSNGLPALFHRDGHLGLQARTDLVGTACIRHKPPSPTAKRLRGRPMHDCWSQVNRILLALSTDGVDKVGPRLPTTYPLKRTERKGVNLTAPQRAAPTEEPLAE